MDVSEAFAFAIGLLVANVPEGLLPIITLALAVGVRELARQGAVVKRLSAVETLGSTNVICTDKTGTVTENRMHMVAARAGDRLLDPLPQPYADPGPTAAAAAGGGGGVQQRRAHRERLHRRPDRGGAAAVRRRLRPLPGPGPAAAAPAQFHFDPKLRLMSTVDAQPEDGSGEEQLWLHTKGAPEEVLARCDSVIGDDGSDRPLDDAYRERFDGGGAHGGRAGAAGARGGAAAATGLPADRDDAERELTLLGFVAMIDPAAAGGAGRGGEVPHGGHPDPDGDRRPRRDGDRDRPAGRHRPRRSAHRHRRGAGRHLRRRAAADARRGPGGALRAGLTGGEAARSPTRSRPTARWWR